MEISPRKSLKRTQEHVDEWLQSQGYFRKHIPRDPTCLFRAVSEQVYLTQYYHIRVRKECVEFMRRERHLFEELVSIPYDSYLEQMACFTEAGGMNEIEAMSLLYKRDVILFNAQKQTYRSVTNNGFTNYIYLCHTPQKQYESVYTKNFVMAAGFCQSIIYQTLYKNVFNMNNVENTVHKMLHDRSATLRHDKFFLKGNIEIREQLTTEIYKRIENNYNVAEDTCSLSKSLPPFPYRVAKALDSNIYRNIDFDVWHEIRREIKNAGWTRYNSNGLQIGDKCLIEMNFDKNDSDGINNNASTVEENQSNDEIKALQRQSNLEPIFCGHIQEISKNEGSVVVFIEELGEKKTVPYSSLKPLSFRKNKQNKWTPIYKQNVRLIDSNQKYRKPCSLNTNKPKELINDVVTAKVENTERSFNNNKTSVTINEICNNTSNVTAPLTTVDTTTNMAVTSNNKDNNVNGKREDFPDRQGKGQSWDKKCQILGDNSLGKSSNYIKNKYVPQFHEQGGIQENKMQDSGEDNSQSANENSSLYYVTSDGNSYPGLPYAPGYQVNRQSTNNSTQKCVDLNGCDLPLSDPAMLKFFYNLGLEYFRVNHAWNNGQSLSPDTSQCLSIPAQQNAGEVQNIGICMLENDVSVEQKESTENNANNNAVSQSMPKTMDVCISNSNDIKKDKSPKMEYDKNTITTFAQENVKDTENVGKDKQRGTAQFKKGISKDRHYNNGEKTYSHPKNSSKQHQNNCTTFCESPNIPNAQNGNTQLSYINPFVNQAHGPPGVANSCHMPYVQQQPPYANVPYCENEVEPYGTYGVWNYMPQEGFSAITCVPNSDVADASNIHSFLPCFYPNAETYSPAYPAVYTPYMHPQQTAYAGLPPQNIHDSWYSLPEQHYYYPYGPVPLRTAEHSNEIIQINNSNSST